MKPYIKYSLVTLIDLYYITYITYISYIFYICTTYSLINTLIRICRFKMIIIIDIAHSSDHIFHIILFCMLKIQGWETIVVNNSIPKYIYLISYDTVTLLTSQDNFINWKLVILCS